jgi:glutamyl-tRNA synthetase
MKPARTRFAPSPTGYLHVGGIRTALFAWLVARQSGGSFVLRIEDTDKAREVEGAEEHIIASLRALGLNYDEGPDIGGPFAPYKQSLRLDSYKEWAERLIDTGRAYADPYSKEEIQAFREQAAKEKRAFLFRDHRPERPPEWDSTMPLRFRSIPKAYDRHDAVMGDLHTGPEMIDDFIMIKSDGYPTYNFAHIVDDSEMQMTHVIRGQEFLASIPNYLNMYEALGMAPPIMATMPHILGPDGKKKLSKRDGAKDVLDYIRDGFLPDALLNFIASLGWNNGTEQELFSKTNLVDCFNLDRVQSSGARFDEQRLIWMNGAHIRELSIEELYIKCKPFWPQEANAYDETYKKQVLRLVQERLKFLAELPEITRLFFVDLPLNASLITNHKQLNKMSMQELDDLLQAAKNSLQNSDFTIADLTKRLNDLLLANNQKPVILFSLIRIATTQTPASPQLMDTLSLLGKERSLQRIDTQLNYLKKTAATEGD